MKTLIRATWLGGLLAGMLLLTACRPDINSDEYDTQMGASQQVQQGVIIQLQTVKSSQSTGLGGLAGAIAGGVLGSTLGGPGAGVANTVGTVGGVVVGGIAGNAAEHSLSDQSALQYIVKLSDSGQIISVVQGVKEQMQPGDHVLVLSGGGQRTRVILDKSYTPK